MQYFTCCRTYLHIFLWPWYLKKCFFALQTSESGRLQDIGTRVKLEVMGFSWGFVSCDGRLKFLWQNMFLFLKKTYSVSAGGCFYFYKCNLLPYQHLTLRHYQQYLTHLFKNETTEVTEPSECPRWILCQHSCLFPSCLLMDVSCFCPSSKWVCFYLFDHFPSYLLAITTDLQCHSVLQ